MNRIVSSDSELAAVAVEFAYLSGMPVLARQIARGEGADSLAYMVWLVVSIAAWS